MSVPIRQVSDLKNSVAGMMTGVDLDDVTNLYQALERAGRILMQKAKMPEAVGRQFFNLYSGVYDYNLDLKLYGTSMIDLRPVGVSRSPLDYVYKDNIEDFDRTKKLGWNGYKTTVEFNNGQPILRVSTPNTIQQIVIDPMNALTGWAAGGSATTLALDTTVYYEQPAALSFNVSAGANPSNAYIEKTLANPINLSTYQQAGVVFLAIYIPSGDLLSVGVHLGDNNANYYDISNTAAFLGSFQVGQYQLIALNLSAATPTGAVDTTKIQYIRCYVNTDGAAVTGIRMGGVWISLPSPVELIYGTAALFLNSSTLLLEQKITSDNDYIILSDQAYLLYEVESAIAVASQPGGSLASGLVAGWQTQLNGARSKTGAIIELGLYDLYRGDNPTQELHTTGNWYF